MRFFQSCNYHFVISIPSKSEGHFKVCLSYSCACASRSCIHFFSVRQVLSILAASYVENPRQWLSAAIAIMQKAVIAVYI